MSSAERLHEYTVKVTYLNNETSKVETHWESSLASSPDGALTAVLDSYSHEIDMNGYSQLNAEVYEGKDNKGESQPLAVLYPKAV